MRRRFGRARRARGPGDWKGATIDAARWFERWRLFFIACAELFGYRGGNEWWVTHVRMSRPERAQ